MKTGRGKVNLTQKSSGERSERNRALRTVKTFISTLLAALVLQLAATEVQAEYRQPLLFILTSGSPQTQGMAFVLAAEAQRQGAEVQVLLCDEAGQLALRDSTATTLKPRDVSPKQMLQDLLQRGAKVEVCALFLPNAGRAAEDLLDGIGPAAPPAIVEKLLRTRVRLLTF